MRIDTLRFKNINSLKGEWKIDFDQSPLADAGVFAITGSNGSGKTSILDAITLGLYGETFKFDHPSSHVMTEKTDESFSEVVFTLGGEKYRSSWSVKRENGQMSTPEMKIAHLNGTEQVMSGQPGKVRSYMTELTGLDFRRFTRSIVLAQGDFAAFLNALDNERLGILEKIISPDVYTDFKQDILDKGEQEKNKLEQLQKDLATVNLMKPEELEAREHDLLDFKAQVEEFKVARERLDEQHDSVQVLEAIAEQIATLEQSVEQARQEGETIKAEADRVESVKELDVIQSDIAGLENKKLEIEESTNTLQAYRNELKQLEISIGQLDPENHLQEAGAGKTVSGQIESIEKLKQRQEQLTQENQSEAELASALQDQIQEKQTMQQPVETWLEQNQGDKRLVDAFPNIEALKKVRQEVEAIKQEMKDLLKTEKGKIAAIKKKTVDIDKLKKDKTNLKATVDKLEKDLQSSLQDQTLEDFEEMLTEQQERLEHFKGLMVIAEDYSKVGKPKGGLLGRSAPKEQYTEELAKEYETLLEQLEQETNIKVALEKAVAWEAQLIKHEQDRKLLEDGEPCPLCGSHDHPFAKILPEQSDSSKALADQQKKLQVMQSKVDNRVGRIKASQALRKEFAEQNTFKTELESYWLELCNRLNINTEDFVVTNFKEAKHRYANEKKELNAIETVIKKVKVLQGKQEQQKTLLEQKTAALQEMQSEPEQAMSEAVEISPHALQALDISVNDSIQEENELTEQLTGQLEELGLKFPARGKEHIVLDKLNQRRQDYENYLSRQQGLKEELINLNRKLEDSKTNSEALTRQFEDCSNKLHHAEVAGLHLSLVEKQKLIADKEQIISRQREAISGAENQLQSKLEQSGIANIDEAQKIADLKQKIPAQQQLLSSLDQQIAENSVELEKRKAELHTASMDANTELSLEEIEIKQKGNASQLSIANQEIRHTESVLAQQVSLKTKFQNLKQQIEQQRSATAETEKEVQEVLTESSADFRRRVQQVMIGKLMSSSNEYLDKISGRYRIHQSVTRSGLGLEIEDTYQDNSRRTPRTLSGGESFVVSLSLALGLSELANSGKSVDSLFLDEGFGTLDEETLYVVLSTLESLHHNGKMVGVISHIKELKNRIRTQIRLTREEGGNSRLEVIS